MTAGCSSPAAGSNERPVTVAFHAADNLPGDVTTFWRAATRANDPVNSFLSGPDWFAMMAKGRGPDCQVAVLRNTEGAVKVVAPLLPDTRPIALALGGRQLARIKIPVVAVCGGDLVDFGADHDELDVFVRAILERYPWAGGLWCDHAKDGERTRRLSGLSRHHGGYLFLTLYKTAQCRIVMPDSAASLRDLRSRKTISKIEGRERALRRACNGECRIVAISHPQDWAPYAQNIESMMNHTWQAEDLGVRFEIGELSELATRGWLRSYLLLAGTEAAAFALCYQSEDVFVYAKIGHDRRFAKYSPGTLLLYRLLQALYDDNTPRYVDLGDGAFGYKRELANDILHSNACLLLRRTPAHLRLLLVYRATQRINAIGRLILERGQRLARRIPAIRRTPKAAPT